MLRKPKEMTFIDIQGSLVSLSRQFILMSVFAPTGELLSFASPKESSQRKGDPDSAYILRFSLLCPVGICRGFSKGHPWPCENERHPCRSPCGPISSNTHRAQELRCSGRNNGSNSSQPKRPVVFMLATMPYQ
jgi:hypothetical protein